MTVYVDELPVSPSPVSRPDSLAEDLDEFFGANGLRKFRDQLNALPAIVGSGTQAGGFALAYTFVAATSSAPDA